MRVRVHVLGESPARRADLSARVDSVPGCEVFASTGAVDPPILPLADVLLLAVDTASTATASTVAALRAAQPSTPIVVVSTPLTPESRALYRLFGADECVDDSRVPDVLRARADRHARHRGVPGQTERAPVASSLAGGPDAETHETELDGILHLAATLFDAPTALVNLTGDRCRWCGTEVLAEVTPGGGSCPFCPYAIEQADTLIVPDAEADIRFRDSVRGIGSRRTRFYAGAPLVNARGEAIGVLCVVDTVAHDPERGTVETLLALAGHVMSLSTLRRQTLQFATQARAHGDIGTEVPAAPSAQETGLGSLDGILFEVDPDTLAMTHVSYVIEHLFGYRRDWWLSQTRFWQSLVVEEDRAATLAAARRCAASGRDEPLEVAFLDSRGDRIRLRGRIQRIDAGQEGRRLRFLLVDLAGQATSRQEPGGDAP